MHCITSLSLDLRDRNRIWAQRTHYNESSFCESCKKKLAWKNNVHFFVQNWGGDNRILLSFFCSDFAFCATNYPQKSGICCCFLDTDLARNCPKKKFGRGCRSTRRWCDIGWMCTTPPMLLLRKSVPPASTALAAAVGGRCGRTTIPSTEAGWRKGGEKTMGLHEWVGQPKAQIWTPRKRCWKPVNQKLNKASSGASSVNGHVCS